MFHKYSQLDTFFMTSFFSKILFFKRQFSFVCFGNKWEKVTTTKITTSKTKKNIKKFANHHYIESPFLVDHYYGITTSKMGF